MFILKHDTAGDVFGPYATKRHAIMARPSRDRDHWKPISIGKRTHEQAMELGAAITSAKIAQ